MGPNDSKTDDPIKTLGDHLKKFKKLQDSMQPLLAQLGMLKPKDQKDVTINGVGAKAGITEKGAVFVQFANQADADNFYKSLNP